MDNIKQKFPLRVQNAVRAWERYTQNMRECRKRMLEHYAAGWYRGGGGNRTPQPLNLIERGIQIVAPFLVTNNPAVMISPRRGINSRNVRAFTKTLELALAHLFNEIRLADYTLRPAVIDSLFSMGITKTGIMQSHQVEIGGYLHDIGQPYCDKIDFDDYIGDVSARNRQEMKMEGHKYRLREEYVKTSGLYKNYDKLTPDLNLFGSTRPETVGKVDVQEWDYNELHPTVELMDIWLPEENLIITLAPEGQGEKIIREVEWDGPEEGPFDILAYKCFPNSVIPIPPAYTWLDLNKMVNVLVSKMRDQAEREKTVGLYNQGVADEAERIKNASDGEMVGVSTTEAFKELTFGGFNAQSFPFVQFLLAEHSKSGPNLEVIGGLSSQAQTLGQEQMLQSNAARALDDMVNQAYTFTQSISRKLAWFLWSDPLIQIPLIKRVAGIDVPTEYSEEAREGDFLDYAIDIVPFSMARLNPEMKYQKLMQLISQIVLPTAQIAAQQGSMLQVDGLVKYAADYLGITNIDEWWKSAIPQTTNMNPYQPNQMVGSIKSGQGDDRFGRTTASQNANMGQQQARAGGQPSPPQKERP